MSSPSSPTAPIHRKAFVSASHRDVGFVRRQLLPFLRSLGFECWFYDEERESGSISDAVGRAIESSDWLVVVISKNEDYTWIRSEIALWKQSKGLQNVVPVRRDEIPLERVHPFLLDLQAYSWRNQRRELARALGSPVAPPRRGTALLLAATAIVTALLCWVFDQNRFLDLLHLESAFESAVMRAGDFFAARAPDDRVHVIAIDEPTTRTLGRPFDGPDRLRWRKEHATVVRNLTRAGVKVIAFDIMFEADTEFDEDFAAAIREARQAGTHVVVGIDELSGDEPRIAPALRRVVSGYGAVCVEPSASNVRYADLAVSKRSGARERIVPGFALAVLGAWLGAIPLQVVGLEGKRRELWIQGVKDPIGFYEQHERKKRFDGCKLLEIGDFASFLAIRFATRETAGRPRWISYRDVLAPANERSLGFLAGSIALIGDGPGDLMKVGLGLRMEERFGVEIHAEAVRTLLTGRPIQPLTPVIECALILVLCLGGAFLARAPWRPATAWLAVFIATLATLALIVVLSAWLGQIVRSVAPLISPLVGHLTGLVCSRFR